MFLTSISLETLLRAKRTGLRVLLSTLVAAVFWSSAAVGQALEDVRVGIHPRFTRVVFESDRPLKFQIDRVSGSELEVELDAAAYQRIIASSSGHLQSVRIEPQGEGKLVARLKLRGESVTHSHLVLANPSRLVLDLKTDPNRTAESSAAEEPVTLRIGPKDESPSPPPVATDRGQQDLANSVSTPRAGAALGEDDFGRDRIGTAEDVTSQAAEGTLEEPPPTEVGDFDESLAESFKDSSIRELLEDVRDENLASEGAPEADDELGLAAAGAATEGFDGGDGGALADPAAGGAFGSDGSDGGADASLPESGAPLENSGSGGFTGFLPAAIDHPVALGGIGVALLLLLIFLVIRGQRSEESYESSSPFATDEPFSLGEDEVASAVDEPPLVAEEPAVANGMGVTEIAGEDSVEEAVEEMMTAEAHSEDDEDSFPVLKNGEAAPPPPIAAPVVAMAEPRTVPAANGAALPVIVDERLAGLEERVNELSDAKERLERQVAAQSEELRVQRAAIARTQRVLRTVVRPEDEATEPVPKVS